MPLFEKNTLASCQLRALGLHTDWSSTPCAVVAENVKKFMNADTNEDAQPETLALEFYGLNHAMAIIQQRFDPHEVLPPEVLKLVDAYYRLNTPNAIRAAYYLLWICIREARHGSETGPGRLHMKNSFGQPVLDFMDNIHGGEAGISQKFLDIPPNMTIGKFSQAIEWQFTGYQYGGSFGGIPWQQVNNCLTRMIHGEFSPEMMLDTVWTLSHNNGPIFNKGEMFGVYDSNEIYALLDVQRSGQIPEYIINEETSYSTDELTGYMVLLKQMYPDEIGSYVDWYKVEGLGALKTYPQKKKVQVDTYGMSEWASKAETMKAKAAQEKIAAELMAKEKFDKEYLVIMPGVNVKKTVRPKAA